jgi:thioredoxin-dependent peroxiredoxin
VYFYPKDGTPNCTIQALDFSAMKEKFASYNTQVIGVSKDDLESHKAFAQRNELTIPLLQDVNSELLKQFGALGPLQEY